MDGDVDLEHLNELCNIHSKSIAVFMLTNPNTLGIFSKRIQIITKTIHEHGGLMYYDGANLNAIVGTSRPGDMGFDLIHLTFIKHSQHHMAAVVQELDQSVLKVNS